MQINSRTTASSVAEGSMGTNKTTAQIGKNREARIDTCKKHGHLTDKYSRGKHWKIADIFLIVRACYKTSQSVPILALWGFNGGREGESRWGVTLESGRLRSASTKRATLMYLLTPYCSAAWQSPLTALTPPLLIYLSHRDETDPVDVSPSNHPIMANRSQKRGEKNRKSVRERNRYRFDQIYCCEQGWPCSAA